MKLRRIASIFTAVFASGSLKNRTNKSYGYNKNGGVKTDLSYIREIGMPGVEKGK